MRRYGPLCLALWTLGACKGPDASGNAPDSDSLVMLRADVERLADSAAVLFGSDAAVLAIGADTGDVVVRADTELLESMIRHATQAYLDSVALHLSLNDVEVGDRGDVRQSLGLFSVPVGSWEVRVAIQRVDATLRAEPARLAVADSNRLELEIPVHVSGATGEARVRFSWDAAAVPGLFCGDFELDETFRGFVQPTEYALTGFFEFETRDNAVVASPRQTEYISISPEPEPSAWERVRQVLDEKDGILSCGLGLDPADLERQLRGLLGRGFDFKLPESLLRPISAPVAVQTTLELGGARHGLEVSPLNLRLTPEALQYSVSISVVDSASTGG